MYESEVKYAAFASFLLCMYVWRIMYACVCATRATCAVCVVIAVWMWIWLGVFRCCATAAARQRDSAFPTDAAGWMDLITKFNTYILYTIHKVIYLLFSCICMHYCICMHLFTSGTVRVPVRDDLFLFCFVLCIYFVSVCMMVWRVLVLFCDADGGPRPAGAAVVCICIVSVYRYVYV